MAASPATDAVTSGAGADTCERFRPVREWTCQVAKSPALGAGADTCERFRAVRSCPSGRNEGSMRSHARDPAAHQPGGSWTAEQPVSYGDNKSVWRRSGERVVEPRMPRTRQFGLSDCGRHRAKNEDAFLSDERLGLFVVCDGVGGRRSGEIAAGEAIAIIQEHVSRACFRALAPSRVLANRASAPGPPVTRSRIFAGSFVSPWSTPLGRYLTSGRRTPDTWA